MLALLVTMSAGFSPQWWWSAIFLPGAGGLGWLAKYAFDVRVAARTELREDRTEMREERGEEWTHITQVNEMLSNQVQTLVAKSAQYDPTLAQIQKEWRETLTREMTTLEQLRDVKIERDGLQSKMAQFEVDRLNQAAEILRLRVLIMDKGFGALLPDSPLFGKVTVEQISESEAEPNPHGPDGSHEAVEGPEREDF